MILPLDSFKNRPSSPSEPEEKIATFPLAGFDTSLPEVFSILI
jgi:hypothetical protein